MSETTDTELRELLAAAERDRDVAREERDFYHATVDVLKAKIGATALRGVPNGTYWSQWHETHCAAAEGAAHERDRAERAEGEVARLNEGIAALVEAWGCESSADACHPLCCKAGQLRSLLQEGE